MTAIRAFFSGLLKLVTRCLGRCGGENVVHRLIGLAARRASSSDITQRDCRKAFYHGFNQKEP
jgi:hypothetical protein